jgi:hypothetical protein
MEAQVAQIVFDTFKDHPDFTAVVGNRFFPLRADLDTALPYAVYRVDEDEEKSKDGAKAYFATVVVVFAAQSYIPCLSLKDAIAGILEQSEHFFIPRGGNTVYDDETDQVYGIVSFEIMNQ